MPTPPPTMFNRFRRRRTCNAQGLVGLDARGGWEGMSLERGAARSAAALDFPRALPIAKSLQIDAKCAESADTEPFSALFRGPKNAKSVANAPRSAPGLCEARRGAPPPLYRAVDEKFRKLTSIAPRSAREFLADGRDMDPCSHTGGGGSTRPAARSAAAFRKQGFLDPFQDRKICKSTSNGPRSAPKVLVDVRD
ncbi:hypothetical protein EV715DRAFT_298316 [Schizophyllum commune]